MKRHTAKKPRSGAACPPYCSTNLTLGFNRYEKEMARTDVCDPTGIRIYFLDHNFPKLIQLAYQGSKAHASRTLAALRSGQIKETDYQWDNSRFLTLFWIPVIVTNPDAIHPNIHGRIEGDEIYVKRFAKAGAPFKLVFTGRDRSSGNRIVTTSFFAPDERLNAFAGLPTRWARGK